MFNIEKRITNALKRAALKGQSISHDKLAADAGVSKQTLYNIFSRDDAKLSQLYRLAKVLEISLYETFEVEGEDFPPFVEGKSLSVSGTLANSNLSKIKDLEEKNKDLEEKNALYKDYIDNLKGFIKSLEREMKRLHEERGGGRPGGVKQAG